MLKYLVYLNHQNGTTNENKPNETTLKYYQNKSSPLKTFIYFWKKA